jgi:AcrR family transcriptional regulator
MKANVRARKDRSYRGSLGAERASQRRVQLVAAGRARFGANGYAAVSVRSVCVEAGLTERYFYESFENKEELLAAVYLDCVAQLNAQVQAAIDAPGTIEQQARAGLAAYFGFMKSHPIAARVILFEVLGVSAAIDAIYREVMAQFALLLQKKLRLSKGTLVASGLVGAAVQIATQWVLAGFTQPQRAVTDACARIFLAVAGEKGDRLLFRMSRSV